MMMIDLIDNQSTNQNKFSTKNKFDGNYQTPQPNQRFRMLSYSHFHLEDGHYLEISALHQKIDTQFTRNALINLGKLRVVDAFTRIFDFIFVTKGAKFLAGQSVRCFSIV